MTKASVGPSARPSRLTSPQLPKACEAPVQPGGRGAQGPGGLGVTVRRIGKPTPLCFSSLSFVLTLIAPPHSVCAEAYSFIFRIKYVFKCVEMYLNF